MKNLLSTPRGTFHVRTYGNPAHPPVILLHGWPQTGYCWHHLAAHLDGLYVIAPDLRGMGDSNRELDLKFYTKDQMSLDIFAIADAMGIEKFYLGGHDWGGAIAQEMAFLHPERIQKLIIINMVIINNAIGQAKAAEVLIPHQFRSSWYQFFLSIKDLPEALIAGKEETWIRFFSRGISNPVPEDAIQEYTRCYQIPHSITTAANIYRALPQDRERWKKHYATQKVAIPTNLIHGVLDPVIIKEYIIGVEESYSNVTVTKLQGGHFVVDEQPKEVGQAIQQFLLEQ